RVHPDDAPLLEAALTRAHDTGAFFDPIYRIVRPDGSIRWIANRGRVISDEKGEPVSIDGVAIDITERQLAEQRRRQSEERLALATRAAELGIIEWNAVSDVSLWENPRTYEIFGRDPGEGPLNRRQALEAGIVHPDDIQKFELALKAASRPGGTFKLTTRIKRQNDGAWRWLELAGALTTTTDGKPLKLVAVIADITDRKRAESERVSHMKDEFLATLSHELRTPLNAILGWSELLKADGLADATRLQAVEIIDRNARVQTRLIEDLLEMSRIISGKVRLDLQPIDLADIVDAAVESAQPMASTRGVRLSKVIDAGVGKMSGDPARLQQVVTNLLSNAIKFTPVGGNVRVQLAQGSTDIRIIVRDNGSGIAPDFAPFLFDRFAQAEPSHTRRFGGLGLGLSIVKQLVEMHGGNVTAESAGLGKGSTFTVSLPLARVTAGANDDVDDAVRGYAADAGGLDIKLLTGIKILVVDDEPDARELMKRVLETREAKVVTAASAAIGLELVERYRPDIVLSDIGMPGIDGYDFIRQVRALGVTRGGTVPAIAVTAFARAEDRERALLAGYQSHLPKPMQVHQLVAAIAASVPCSP
ncbi:MAG TPA: ATP-binding protein, partial [Myxococcota bacterium]|nr:ATP-binding protein [Myxococcota bacterium]